MLCYMMTSYNVLLILFVDNSITKHVAEGYGNVNWFEIAHSHVQRGIYRLLLRSRQFVSELRMLGLSQQLVNQMNLLQN
jgi:hypothetical protein